MAEAEFREYLRSRARPTGGEIIQPLTNAFSGARLCGEVQQALIRFGSLRHGCQPSVDCSDERMIGFAEILKKISGMIPKCRH